MYAREVEGRTITLTVSGLLWNRSLVMQDTETKSLWSHILGRAMQGPLKGESLEVLPGLMTDWKTWKQRHPDTTVAHLSRTSREYRRDFLKNPSRFVVALAEGDTARAWPFDLLRKQPVVNDRFQNRLLLIAFDAESKTAFLYDRTLNGIKLEFTARDGRLVDTATGSLWNPVTGKCLSGQFAGRQLQPVPGVVSFRRVWKVFHPKTEFYAPD